MMAMHTNCKLRTDQESQVFLAKQDSLDGFPLKLTFRNKIAYLFYRHLFSNIMEAIYRMLHDNVKSHETIMLDITKIRPVKWIFRISSHWYNTKYTISSSIYIKWPLYIYPSNAKLVRTCIDEIACVPITFICIARLNNRLLG